MSDSIQQQKDIFGKVESLMAFLDTTDKQRNRENLQEWKNTFAALSNITSNPLPFAVGLLKNLTAEKVGTIKEGLKAKKMKAAKQWSKNHPKMDTAFKKTKTAFSTRFGLSTTSDPWLRQLDQIIRTSILEVLPRVDDILFEELLKAFNCDMSMLVPTVGDGLNGPLQIQLSEIDLLKQLYNEPASKVGKYMYERGDWTVGYPPGVTPFSMNRFLRDLWVVTPGTKQTVYGSSGKALFDIRITAGLVEIWPYLTGPNTDSVGHLSELYDDDSFFKFNVEEERNISFVTNMKSKNVISLISCGEVEIPIDNEIIDDGTDEILATQVQDEQLKAFDLVLQKVASSSASKAGMDISLGHISLPVEIDFKENLIKKLPEILTYCVLSAKAILPVVVTSRLLNQNGALATNIELFGKLFKRVVIRIVKEFLARVIRHILVLIKNILLRLIRDLIRRKLDEMNKKKIRLIRRS